MRTIVCIVALIFGALAGGQAGATDKRPAPASGGAATASATAHSTATASQAANATGGAGGAAAVNLTGYGPGGGYGGDNLYVLPAPIGGSNLPAGMCQRSQYRHWAVLFNAISSADGDSFTDLECLQLLMRLEDLKRQPLPRQPVALLTEAMPACAPPAKAKSVAAAKKAGACK